MRLTIEMDLDNAAFADDPGEIGRILNDLAGRLPDVGCITLSPLNLHDVNGNHVGKAEVSE